MTEKAFLEELRTMLQCESALSGSTSLADLEEWDSLAFMVLIAFFDRELGLRITFAMLKKCRTPLDLIALTKGAVA